MQETAYRIAFPLQSKIMVTKKLELLNTMESFKAALKEQGHSGQIKNLTCHAAEPGIAECIMVVQHTEENPWLISEYARIRISEKGKKKTIDKSINEEIKFLNNLSPEEQKKHIRDLKDKKLTDYGIDAKDRAKYTETDSFIGKLTETRDSPEKFTGFYIKALWIDPVKPSKKELENEKQYIDNLTPSTYDSLSLAIQERVKRNNMSVVGDAPECFKWRGFKPGEKEALALGHKEFVSRVSRNLR
ncbi:MAG: hypothetical protein NT038_09535 [Euryarchaeota archaeon]|nr:hypothetical protein [Euryarchaeota archaeon]